MKHWMLYVFVLLSSYSIAQSGTISGKVIDAARGEDMIGALVQIESLKMGAATDFDGTYSIKNVPVGTYQVKVSFISYTTKIISDVVVKANGVTELNISMQEMVIESEAVEIVDFKRTDTEASALIEMKEAKGVVTVVSNAQIAKSQDRDASEVARRIPGVTVVDNRFVVVRGLSERYNSVNLNNALVPSFESDVKSFAFDVIPSQMIDRFLIYKSPSPDLQGEFAGGAINIFTKTMPENDLVLNVDLGTAFRTGTTFQDFKINQTGNTDWLGYDGGTRSLPSDFPKNVRDITDPEQLQALGRSLPNTWGYTSEKAPLDKRVNVMFGKKFSIGDQIILGTTTAINYSNTSVSFLSERSDYNTYDELLQRSDTIFHYNDSIYQRQARLGVMHNWGLRIGRKHQIEFRNLLNQTGMQENTFRTGVNFEEGSYRREYAYRFNERFIYSGQLNGNHEVFGKQGKVEWNFGYAATKRSDPDWRRIRYTLPLDGSQEQWTAYIPFSAQPFYLGRLYIDLNEKKWMSSASYEHRLAEMGEDLKGEKQFMTVKAGYYLEQKNRDFSIRNIGYAPASFATFGNAALAVAPIDQILSEQNINTTDGLKLDEDTKPADSYNAANRLVAGYLMLSIPYKRWNFSGGLRAEQNRQTLSSFTIQNQALDVIQDTLLLLPSANFSYNIGEKSLVRASFGKTVNRPEFREMAPYYFYDFVFNSIYSGNSTIKFATATNYDLRWEFYPKPTELISAGVFYKQFNNPIEMYFLTGAGGGGTRSFIPGNANMATSYGLEVDIRKSLAETFSNKILNKFSVVANFSLIQSEVKLAESDANTGVANKRAMMGQSPYVVNLGLYYQNDDLGLSMSALYNVVGPRIVIVGIPGIPEVFEMPRNLLDLSITKSITDNWSVRFGAQDLLNQKFALLQDANGDGKLNRETDQVMQSYRRGTYYSLSIRYQFKK